MLPKGRSTISLNCSKAWGKMEGEYSIQLEEGAKPFALTATHRVPVPLMKVVRTELQWMQDLGVITQVSNRTYRLVCGYGGCSQKE